MRSAWDSTIAGTMRPMEKLRLGRQHGSAPRDLRRSQGRRVLAKGAVSDDYRLTHAIEARRARDPLRARRHGRHHRPLLAPRVFDWAVRQMKITRVYRTALGGRPRRAHRLLRRHGLCLVATAMGEPVGPGALIVTTLPGRQRHARLLRTPYVPASAKTGSTATAASISVHAARHLDLALRLWLRRLESHPLARLRLRAHRDSTRTRILERPPA
ncbi:MAG: hypothetical protein R2724_07050 [Bryobacterales bacterium]